MRKARAELRRVVGGANFKCYITSEMEADADTARLVSRLRG